MVNKTIAVCFGKCTTLLVPKSWPMKAWLRDVDQWKAENLAGFCSWPITRCFIQNDRVRLIIEHKTNFALSGNIEGPCNTRQYLSLYCHLSPYNGSYIQDICLHSEIKRKYLWIISVNTFLSGVLNPDIKWNIPVPVYLFSFLQTDFLVSQQSNSTGIL